MNKRLVRFTKWLLDAMFYGGMVITLGIPVIFRYVGRYIQSFRVHYIPQCVLYIGSGIQSHKSGGKTVLGVEISGSQQHVQWVRGAAGGTVAFHGIDGINDGKLRSYGLCQL